MTDAKVGAARVHNGLLGWVGCEAAVLGVGTQGSTDLLVYSYDGLVQVFIAQGMDLADAMEWVDVNLANAYLGPRTPIILYPDLVRDDD
jgi:hypothetical protein